MEPETQEQAIHDLLNALESLHGVGAEVFESALKNKDDDTRNKIATVAFTIGSVATPRSLKI